MKRIVFSSDRLVIFVVFSLCVFGLAAVFGLLGLSCWNLGGGFG